MAGITDESEDEDEVVTKKKVSKATPKKTKKKVSKEAKKKVSKKIIKKKAILKKKRLAVKGDIKTAKEISKNVQVKPIETGEELFCIIGDPNCCCLDPVKQKFPDPVHIEKDVFGLLGTGSKNPKTISKTKFYFCSLCKNKGCKTDVKNVFPSKTEKWFHGSIHINCKYTKIFSNHS